MKMESSFVTGYTWPWLVKNNFLLIIIFYKFNDERRKEQI